MDEPVEITQEMLESLEALAKWRGTSAQAALSRAIDDCVARMRQGLEMQARLEKEHEDRYGPR